MRLSKIFRFEFAYLARRFSTWLYLSVLLAFTIVMNMLTTPGDGVYPNNTFHITAISVIGGLIWLIMGASIAGESAARDFRMRIHPLVFTTPVTKLEYLGGRFLAALAVNALLLLFLPLGVMLSFYLPGMNQEELLPFRASAYLNVFFFIALPTAFIATALQFSLAALSRQVMASYMMSLLLAIVAQVIAMAIAKLLGNWELVKLLDPIGVAGIIGSELATWTPAEKNTRLITLNGMFLWNRVLWISIALGSLMITYARFNFNSDETKSWWRRFKLRQKTVWKEMQQGHASETTVTRPTPITFPQIPQSFGSTTYFRQTLRIGWTSFKNLASHPTSLTLVASVALVSVMFSDRIMTQFSIPLLPTTQQILTYLTNPAGNIGTPWAIIPLLIIYFSGALIWRERDTRVNEIADAAPVKEWVLLAGKLLGLALLIVAWTLIMMAGGIAMQLSLNYHKPEWSLYLQTLFGLQLLEYLLFAILAFTVHVVVNQKYISYLVMILIFIFIAFPSTFKVEHNMLIFGATPGWSYTDMRGFGTSIGPWLWFKIYWIAWALLLIVTAKLLWVRGREQSFKDRLHVLRTRFTPFTTRGAITAVVLILSVGSFIFYNTNVLNEYNTSADINEGKAEYERLYGQYRNTPQPKLTGTTLYVELYPEKQEAEIRAVYTLWNNHTAPIDTIHLGNIAGIMPEEVKFNRPATAIVIDKKLSHQVYVLKQSLNPGDSLQIKFAVHYKERGFGNNGKKALVVKHGTYFTNYDLLLSIGYQGYREINDAVTRKKYKLAARPAIPSLYDTAARKKPVTTDQNTFEAIVGTAKDEVAVGPGRLIKSWTESNRRYFQFKTDTAIRGEYSILSGMYKVAQENWDHVAISIYYHPDHAMNVDLMLRSVKASMAYYTKQFGPYPFGHLTIIEQPGMSGGASSEATMIDYGEQFSILKPVDGPDGFNLPFYILAHEVAHQWWGGASLRPANVEGAGVLIEGLAVYCGMQVLEKDYGESHLRQFINYVHSFYEMPRSRSTPPLLQANEAFLYYRKSGLAMYAMSRYIGKEKVNGALRTLLEKHHSGELVLPTTLDLYHELEKVTPDSLNYLLNDLFSKNIYWRLRTKKFVATQTKAGNWEVTMKVEAHKVVIDSLGNEKEIPMNDLLEVGMYAESDGVDKPLYLRMHRIRSGEQTINVTLTRKPGSGGIDPNNLMIDLRTDDNMMQLDR
jgi:ABC-2 type transport system permease protein